MANVNLKTDFRNGEKLYDYQLNNNFKAIQEALKTMNRIVWQDNADSVVTFRGTTEELMNREIIDGQILYDTNTGESYIDYNGRRISTGSGNAIHIGDTEPTNPSTQIWIPDDGYMNSLGTEVVNSLDGNESFKAPSVKTINDVNKYSTEETFTGKYWTDGKKIYRKVIEITEITLGTEMTYNHNLSIDTVVVSDLFAYRAQGNTSIKFPYNGSVNGSYNANFFLGLNDVQTNTFRYYVGSGWTTLKKLRMILEYTKITDVVESEA